MRNILSIAIAGALLAPIAVAPTQAEARRHYDRDYRDYRHDEWRGRDGRMYCRKSNGTVGLLVGGAGGALVGRAIDTRGDRATGTILGAAAGALIGKSVDSKRTCR